MLPLAIGLDDCISQQLGVQQDVSCGKKGLLKRLLLRGLVERE
jgi:hypothetical protein